jgi:hypothetical protein
MTGMDLIAAIHQRTKQIRTILISDFIEPLGLNEANTGADFVIQKSATEVSLLVASVKGMLPRKRSLAQTTKTSAAAERKRA